MGQPQTKSELRCSVRGVFDRLWSAAATPELNEVIYQRHKANEWDDIVKHLLDFAASPVAG